MLEKEAFSKDKFSYLKYLSLTNYIHVLDSVHLV